MRLDKVLDMCKIRKNIGFGKVIQGIESSFLECCLSCFQGRFGLLKMVHSWILVVHKREEIFFSDSSSESSFFLSDIFLASEQRQR
jgi:hypothetical protein